MQASSLNGVDPSSVRKLSLSIDLLSIKSTQHTPSTVTMRYSVPSLGYNPPIITGVCDVARHGDALVPGGYSNFVIGGRASYQLIAEAIVDKPVQV
jgi:hypothetical protein